MSSWHAGVVGNRVPTPPATPGVDQGALKVMRHKVRLGNKYPSLSHHFQRCVINSTLARCFQERRIES